MGLENIWSLQNRKEDREITLDKNSAGKFTTKTD